jgi:hypothetical protein
MMCNHSVPEDWPKKIDTYYLFGEGYTDADRRREPLKCTLHPVWIDVTGGHFCSSDTSVMNPVAHNAWSLRVSSAFKEADEQRERAIEAEKKLKALRKKMREAK